MKCLWIANRECPHLEREGAVINVIEKAETDGLSMEFQPKEICDCCLKGLEIEMRRKG
jgi:hypothetical protein